MKQGWTYKKLGEVCDFEGGSQPPKNEWVSSPKDGYIRMLQIRDFTKSRTVHAEYVKLSKKLRTCNKDDILIGRYGASVGKILTGLAGAYNVALIKAIPDEKSVFKRFLRRYFESSHFQNILIKVCSSRAAQAGFSKKDIEDTLVYLPSISEQERIVARLDAAFAEIDKLKANAEKQLNEARALFKKTLNEATAPKDEWNKGTAQDVFDDITDFVAAGSFADLKKNVKYKDIPDFAQLVRTTDLKNEFQNKSFVYVDEHAYNYLWRVNLNEECIILPNVGVNCGEVYFVNPSILRHENNVLGPNAILVRSKKVNNHFLAYYMKGVNFQKEIFRITSSMAQPKYNKTNLKKLILFYPDTTEQQAIVDRLDALSESVKELEELNRKTVIECDALKQALLRQIFE